MAFDSYGDPAFGVRDCKVAKYTATDTYEEEVDVMGIQMFASTLVPVSAELPGDDRIIAVHSIMTTGRIRMRFAGAPVTVLAAVMGITPSSSLTTPNQVKNLQVPGGHTFPYFGVIGQSVAAEGVGAQEVFVPKCKIMSEIQATMNEYGAFQVLEFEVQAVDDDTYGLINIIQTEAVRDLTIPPLDIAPIS
ncbi:MAG: hypothetical protein IT328_04625 [Caldilineaceae bacterium]|nr:hypothetical protein [Caldilineaceae bacterium]